MSKSGFREQCVQHRERRDLPREWNYLLNEDVRRSRSYEIISVTIKMIFSLDVTLCVLLEIY